MEPPPSFKGELLYLMAKFLEAGPCKETAQMLKTELNTLNLLPPRYDWTGRAHPKTFRDLEEENGARVPDGDYLLRLCFDLCSANPAVPSVRSLLSHARLQGKSRQAALQAVPNAMQDVNRARLGLGPKPRVWHERHLLSKFQKLRKTLGHLASVYCLTFDRTGRLAFTGADDLLVKCWNVVDGRLLFTFRGGASEISDMTVSHDNRLLAVATLDKIARVWSVHTGEPVAVLSKHSATLTAINFSGYVSPQGERYLNCTGTDGTASFWRYRYDGKEEGKVVFDEQPTRYHEKSRPGKAKIICATFSPGGIFFCTGSADHNVRVYQMNGLEGPQRILEDDSHNDQVDSIQWCNVGTGPLRFVTGSSDGTARIWTYANMKWSSMILKMEKGEGGTTPSQPPPPIQPPPQQQPAGTSAEPQQRQLRPNADSSSQQQQLQRRDGRTVRRAALVAQSSRRNSEDRRPGRGNDRGSVEEVHERPENEAGPST